MKFLNDKVRIDMCREVRAKNNRLDVKPGNHRFNQRCHSNAAAEAYNNKNLSVVMVMCIEDGNWPFIHFVNYDKKKKAYIDNTLGFKALKIEYYYIKDIESIWDVDDVFVDYRRHLRENLGLWEGLLSDYQF